MSEQALFTERLRSLRAQYPQYNADLVTELVDAVLGKLGSGSVPSAAALLDEIQDLAHCVATARAEIAALSADDITASHIPSATDELDAIVAHTAAATDTILECCEQLDTMSSRLEGDDTRVVQAVVTRVYEACSFQDITGQRITKVVATLKTIESKVAHMIEVFAPDAPRSRPSGVGKVVCGDTPGLLNGPQLPAAAMDQSDVDALLASFD